MICIRNRAKLNHYGDNTVNDFIIDVGQLKFVIDHNYQINE